VWVAPAPHCRSRASKVRGWRKWLWSAGCRGKAANFFRRAVRSPQFCLAGPSSLRIRACSVGAETQSRVRSPEDLTRRFYPSLDP
jgi:hypothetical protein